MRPYPILLLFCLLLGLPIVKIHAQVRQDSLKNEKVRRSKQFYQEVTLGDAVIRIHSYSNGEGPTYINLHDDENTSALVAQEIVDSLGGTFLQLIHGGHRNLEFHLDSLSHYEADPNRIFTDVGAGESMIMFGDSTAQVHGLLRQLAERILDSLDLSMVVALHNNTEANYSAGSYLDEYEEEAHAVHLNPYIDLDDFFFVTDLNLFIYFKELNYNVVLQDNQEMTDDGSLSVYCGQRGIPYVNVEAQHGHYGAQLEMLKDFFKYYQRLTESKGTR